jgi:hypothetical protein
VDVSRREGRTGVLEVGNHAVAMQQLLEDECIRKPRPAGKRSSKRTMAVGVEEHWADAERRLTKPSESKFHSVIFAQSVFDDQGERPQPFTNEGRDVRLCLKSFFNSLSSSTFNIFEHNLTSILKISYLNTRYKRGCLECISPSFHIFIECRKQSLFLPSGE